MSDITVIIPAYNAVKTVERTIRSVMASVIPLEVWVVDDGSTDGTGSLLDELVGRQGEWKSSSTLRVIHQANCGAYQARLAALKQIATPYFGFVDADDRVEPEMFAKMLDFVRADSLDVVQVGYRGPSTGERRILADRALWCELVRPIILEGRGSCFVWDKLYRNQYDFASFDPTNHVTNWEDLIFNLQFFAKVRRFGFMDEPLYHYEETEGSAVRKFRWRLIKDFLETVRMRRKMSAAYKIRPWGWTNLRWAAVNMRNIIALGLRGMK